MFRRTRTLIDSEALRHNLNLLKEWNGSAFFCPMVKANAYGHGDIEVARILDQQGCSALGVALIEEGLRLRRAGIRSSILTFSALNEDAAAAALAEGLTPVVGRFEDIQALDRARTNNVQVKVHLKFNTGMQRMGFDAADLSQLKAELNRNPWLEVVGLCTHLTHGEEADRPDGFTQRQLQRFNEMSRGFEGAVRHAHKSASLAVLAGLPKDPTIGGRPGIGLYGLPHEGRQIGPGLRPVLTWATELVRVHVVEKGETVSYSGRWTASRRSYIGVVPLGYGDGYHRVLSNKGFMLCRGRRVPVVGSVCMDYTLLDLTDLSAEGIFQPGEAVVALGGQGREHIGAAELAEAAGTIAYEIVTHIAARVSREVV